MRKNILIVFVLISLALSGCATIYNPATQREELIFITTPMEVSIGNNVASQIERQYKISTDAEKIKRVSEIGDKVAAVSDRKDLKYHFKVIEDKDLNAFTTPGGYLYINSGVVDVATDDELACVIGHEIGHVAARHIAKKLQAQLGYDILMNIAFSKGNARALQKAASLSFGLISLGYSRDDELFSDRLGIKYAYKAGYDPYAMITFLKRLQETKNADMGPVFLRSHPYTSDRIKKLEAEIPGIIQKAGHKDVSGNISVDTQPGEPREDLSGPRKTKTTRVMCPRCRRIFSSRLSYCPYDGSRLK